MASSLPCVPRAEQERVSCTSELSRLAGTGTVRLRAAVGRGQPLRRSLSGRTLTPHSAVPGGFGEIPQARVTNREPEVMSKIQLRPPTTELDRRGDRCYVQQSKIFKWFFKKGKVGTQETKVTLS